MMRYTLQTSVLISLLIVAAAAPVKAFETAEIELTDGSVLYGEIISMAGGIYTVRSGAIGTLQIDQSRIRSMKTKGAPSGGGDVGSQVKALQERMVSDGDIIDLIRSLQNDSDFQEILQDPLRIGRAHV